MKGLRLACAAVPIVLLACAGAEAAGRNDPKDIAAIEAIQTTLYESTDADRVMAGFADDAAMIDRSGTALVRGTAAIRAAWLARHGGAKARKPDFRQVDIVSSGNFACVAMQVREITTTADGASIEANIRHLDALRKIDGIWKIVQHHESYPSDQKTGRPVTDAVAPREPRRIWYPTDDHAPAIPAEQAKSEIYDWMKSGTETTSAGQMMAWYATDPRIILYDTFAPGFMRGPDRIRDYYTPMMEDFGSVQTQFPEFVADSDGELGAQMDTQILDVRMKSGNSNVYKLRQNDCVVRIKGRWHTFLEAISVPADEAPPAAPGS